MKNHEESRMKSARQRFEEPRAVEISFDGNGTPQVVVWPREGGAVVLLVHPAVYAYTFQDRSGDDDPRNTRPAAPTKAQAGG